jgi:hypothetical protein
MAFAPTRTPTTPLIRRDSKGISHTKIINAKWVPTTSYAFTQQRANTNKLKEHAIIAQLTFVLFKRVTKGTPMKVWVTVEFPRSCLAHSRQGCIFERTRYLAMHHPHPYPPHHHHQRWTNIDIENGNPRHYWCQFKVYHLSPMEIVLSNELSPSIHLHARGSF